jgi:hypothetical protein
MEMTPIVATFAQNRPVLHLPDATVPDAGVTRLARTASETVGEGRAIV